MTRQELYDEVNRRIKALTDELENPPMKFKFYKDFVDKYRYNFKNLSGLIELPYVDFAIALLYAAVEDEISFERVDKDIKDFGKILEDLNSNQLNDVEQMVNGFLHTNHIEDILYIFSDDNKKRAIKLLREIFHGRELSDEAEQSIDDALVTFERLIYNNKQPGWNMTKLIYYFQMSPVSASNTISIIRILKGYKEKKDEIDLTNPAIVKSENVQNIMLVCNSIIECRRIQKEAYKKTEDHLKNKISIYKKFLKDMDDAFSKDEIRNYEIIIRSLSDDLLKMDFLKLVHQHNLIKYQEIDAIHDQLTKNSLVNYLDVLRNNGIKKDDVDLNKLMRNTCDDLDKMFKILNSIVGDKKMIIKIAEISDLDNVRYLQELKTKGVLNTGAFLKYPEIFVVDSAYRRVLDKNIEAIGNFNIDYTMFSKNPDILIDNINLEENLILLESYGLIDYLKNTKKYSFLKKDDLCNIIDKVIELGYEDLLLEDISLLNESNWDRIYVLKSMGLLPKNKKELLKYLRDDGFFVSDDKLHLYIENVSEYYDGLDISYETNMGKIIDDYTITERTLNFNGVVISKPRVARNITSNEFDVNDLFNAIIKDSILNIEEIESIKAIFKNKVYKLD